MLVCFVLVRYRQEVPQQDALSQSPSTISASGADPVEEGPGEHCEEAGSAEEEGAENHPEEEVKRPGVFACQKNIKNNRN